MKALSWHHHLIICGPIVTGLENVHIKEDAANSDNIAHWAEVKLQILDQVHMRYILSGDRNMEEILAGCKCEPNAQRNVWTIYFAEFKKFCRIQKKRYGVQKRPQYPPFCLRQSVAKKLWQKKMTQETSHNLKLPKQHLVFNFAAH